MTTARIVFGLTLLWAVLALAAQARAARGRRRADFSRPAGSAARGLRYAFTGAMTPRHKETIRLHPIEFTLGLLLHVGVAAALLGIGLLGAGFGSGATTLRALRPLLGLALAAGLALIVRRLVSRNLRAISAPDDFLAALATCALLAVAATVTAPKSAGLLFCGSVYLIYLPLGKLRHVLFCPLARGDVGLRLGRRGVYPPPRGRESLDGARS